MTDPVALHINAAPPAMDSLNGLPPRPSITTFSFRSIGKQPELLSRFQDPPEQDGNDQQRFSPSPSPDLEEALIPSESSPEDNGDPSGSEPPRRNRLMEALAPHAQVRGNNDEEIYVNDTSNPSASPIVLQRSPTSQPWASTQLPSCTVLSSQSIANALSSNANQKAFTDGTSNSIVAHPDSHGQKSLNIPPSQISAAPPFPPTPPAEYEMTIPPSLEPTTNPLYLDLLTALRVLQADIDAPTPEEFKDIRELAQAAKVEATSLSLSNQKTVSFAQKALACAQEAMQASQESVETARAVKKRLEALTHRCEMFIEEHQAKEAQRREALRQRLESVQQTVSALEKQDRLHSFNLQQAVEERRQAEQGAAQALEQTKAAARSTSPSTAESHSNQVKMLFSIVENLQKEVQQLKRTESSMIAAGPSHPSDQAPTASSKSHVHQTTSGQLAETLRKEQELKNKLLSQKSLGEPSSSSTGPRSSASSAPGHHPQHARSASGSTSGPKVLARIAGSNESEAPLDTEHIGPAANIKVEPEDETIPPAPLPTTALPRTSPAVKLESPRSSVAPSQAGTLQLEYPPESRAQSTFRHSQGHMSPALNVVTSGTFRRSPVKPHSIVPAEEEESPVSINRQGSDPGNLPIVLDFVPQNRQELRARANSRSPQSTRPRSTSVTQQSVTYRAGFPAPAPIHVPSHARDAPIPPPSAQHPMHPPSSALNDEHPPAREHSPWLTATSTSEQPSKGKAKSRSQATTLHQSQTSVPNSPPISVPPASSQLSLKPSSIVAASSPIVQAMAQHPPAPSAAQTNSFDMSPREPAYLAVETAFAVRGDSSHARRREPLPTMRRGGDSYRPGRLPSRSRSRSPVRRGDHYSPPRYPPRTRSRSPPPPRRPLTPPRRLSPPRRGLIHNRTDPSVSIALSAPPTTGTKRPLEEQSADLPLPTRRRIDSGARPPTPPRREEPGMQSAERASPASSSGVSLGSQASAHNLSYQERPDHPAGYASLKSRISLGRPPEVYPAEQQQSPARGNRRLQGRSSPEPEPPGAGGALLSRMGEPSPVQLRQPNYLLAGRGPAAPAAQRGRSSSNARGRGVGRGGSTQPLTSRISAPQHSNLPLAQRIKGKLFTLCSAATVNDNDQR